MLVAGYNLGNIYRRTNYTLGLLTAYVRIARLAYWRRTTRAVFPVSLSLFLSPISLHLQLGQIRLRKLNTPRNRLAARNDISRSVVARYSWRWGRGGGSYRRVRRYCTLRLSNCLGTVIRLIASAPAV